MTVPVRLPPGVPAWVRSLRHDALLAALLSGVAAAWAVGWLWPSFASDAALVWASTVVTTAFVTAGVFVLREPDRRTAGTLILLAGAMSPLSSGVGWDWDPVPVVRSFEGVFWVVLLWGILSYQDLRLGRIDKLFVGYMWLLFVGGQLAWNVVSIPPWQGYPAAAWWPSLFPDRASFDAIGTVLDIATFAAVAWFSALIVVRNRRTSRLDRHSFAPVALATAVAGLIAAAAWVEFGATTIVDRAVLCMIPLAFLASAVRRRLLQGRLTDALATMSGTPTPAAVQDMLRSELRDPSVEVLYWAPEQQAYVDESGRSAPSSSNSDQRMRIPVITSEGRPLAVVTTDPLLSRQRSFVETAVRASGLALENARLHAVVQAQLESIRQAQSRIVQVGLDERRRLERNLHDGAQQRLLSVATSIGLASSQATGDHLHTLSRAGQELQEALRELRELARGLHPAILSSEGLAAAVQVVAERLPIAIRVAIDPTRLPPAVESTAYFVICEALVNIVKHAGATHATVTAHLNGPRLSFDICDDGVGGAVATGSGVSGMTDRVRAMGGQLNIRSEPLGGTLITAWLPTR